MLCKLVLQKGEKNDFHSELTFLSIPTKAKVKILPFPESYAKLKNHI